MRRRHVLLAGVVAAAMSFAMAAGAGAASGATVELHGTLYGYTFLVDSSGYTLYAFSKDKGYNKNKTRERCQRVKGCTTMWPPLLVTETPTAGPGVDPMLLSTVTLRNGSQQVTYAGRPLYTTVHDTAPFEIYYFGVKEFRGHWYGVNPMGGVI